MATIQVTRGELSLAEKLYIPEVMRGVAITTRQLVKNVFGRKDIATRQYPDVKKPYPERFRGRHRLTWRDDGSVRCVACMLCSTACPANCIHIVAGDKGDNTVEKYPVSFEIDLLVCVYCGFCEEACPCDAIRMDSGKHPMPSFSRDKQRIRKVQLLEEGQPSTSHPGGLGN
ncbi:MAG: NADH-quinone oxidoreductase subunit I [Deltaproteobacteria bacterium]|nr:MAG: NADH-quinone oxidoreductase subunit I [Deltaproteobacteria bacterium]